MLGVGVGVGVGEALVLVAAGPLAGLVVLGVDVGFGAGCLAGFGAGAVVGCVPGFLVVVSVCEALRVVPLRDVVRVVVVRVVVVPPSLDRFVVTVVCVFELG